MVGAESIGATGIVLIHIPFYMDFTDLYASAIAFFWSYSGPIGVYIGNGLEDRYLLTSYISLHFSLVQFFVNRLYL